MNILYEVGVATYAVLLVLGLLGPLATFFAVFGRQSHRAVLLYGAMTVAFVFVIWLETYGTAFMGAERRIALFGYAALVIVPRFYAASLAVSVGVALVAYVFRGRRDVAAD